MADSKRNNRLDALRGMAMLFVIFGHVGNALTDFGVQKDSLFSLICMLVNPVKVPLFFVISGYLFKAYDSKVKEFFIKIFKARIIPYAIWGSFMGVAAFCADFLRSGFLKSAALPLLFENWLIPLVRGNLIWFIPCLTVAEILLFAVCKISKKRKLPCVLFCVALTALGYALSGKFSVTVWKIDTALTSMQFMCLGNMLKRIFAKTENEKVLLKFFSFSFLYILLLTFFGKIWKNCTVDVNMGIYFNKPAFTLLSFAGIYAAFSLAKFAENIKPLVFVGKNTFIYFVWHMYAVQFIMIFLKKPLLLNPFMSVAAFAVTLLSAVLTAAVCIAVNKFFPFTVGKYGRRK